jgi:hypothetical protein
MTLGSGGSPGYFAAVRDETVSTNLQLSLIAVG